MLHTNRRLCATMWEPPYMEMKSAREAMRQGIAAGVSGWNGLSCAVSRFVFTLHYHKTAAANARLTFDRYVAGQSVRKTRHFSSTVPWR